MYQDFREMELPCCFSKMLSLTLFSKTLFLQQSTRQLSPKALQVRLNIAGGVALFGCFIGLLLTYGLFTLKGWAWIITMVFAILGILSDITTLVRGQANPGWIVFELVINAVIIYYLLQPQVKRAFGR